MGLGLLVTTMTFECKFTQAEIAAALNQYEDGADRKELCARLGTARLARPGD